MKESELNVVRCCDLCDAFTCNEGHSGDCFQTALAVFFHQPHRNCGGMHDRWQGPAKARMQLRLSEMLFKNEAGKALVMEFKQIYLSWLTIREADTEMMWFFFLSFCLLKTFVSLSYFICTFNNPTLLHHPFHRSSLFFPTQLVLTFLLSSSTLSSTLDVSLLPSVLSLPRHSLLSHPDFYTQCTFIQLTWPLHISKTIHTPREQYTGDSGPSSQSALDSSVSDQGVGLSPGLDTCVLAQDTWPLTYCFVLLRT